MKVMVIKIKTWHLMNILTKLLNSYLQNIIINLQYSDTWKIQLRVAMTLFSSKDTEEERIMYLSSGNIKLTS